VTNEELVQEYQKGNKQALDDLIQQNTGLVMYFANKYKGFCSYITLDFDDLIQEGWMGFIKAVEKYNPNVQLEQEERESTSYINDKELKKAVMFASFAGRLIQTKMLRAINKCIPRKKKSDIYSDPVRVNSINALLPGSYNTTLEVMLTDEESMETFKNVESKFDNEILRKDLLLLLDSVFGGEFQYNYNERDLNGVEHVKSLFTKLLDGINAKEVLLLHYGLFRKPMTYREIGQTVGLSASRIEQIENKGLYAIRNHSTSKDFMEKYKIKYVEELYKRKDSIHQYRSPERVVESMELIDKMMKKYI
jgi:RNA polymerase sigma factor (sigma-70 family)